MARIGYARVSTTDQHLEGQLARLTHVNAAMLAIREGELIGELFGEAVKLTFPAVSAIANSDDLISTVVNGGALQGIEAHAPDAPRVKDVLISAAPLTHEGEAINGCVITMIDLSQRKVTESSNC